jgi:transcriptional regulator with PAS, ATPase and Fis domain
LLVQDKTEIPEPVHTQSVRAGASPGAACSLRASTHPLDSVPATLTDNECVTLARWARGAVPGLMHLLRAAYLAGQNESLTTQTGGFELPVKPGSGPLEQASPTLRELEREHLERVLTESRTVEEAAQKLGIAASTLWRKRKRYNLR